MPESPPAIHNSDVATFKKCRQQWDFVSPLRSNLEPLREKPALPFGTAIHAALAAYYDPSTDRDPGPAWEAFVTSIAGYWNSISLDHTDEEVIEYREAEVLGTEMLKHYFGWAPQEDDFTVVWVERAFTIPILDGKAVYSFKPDGLVKDKKDNYWLLEHKTAKYLPENTEYLMMDDQAGRYLWGCEQVLGFRPEGVIYNFLRKKAPQVPRVLKDGFLSKDKRIDTTHAMALQGIKDWHEGEVPAAYNEFLQHLLLKGNRFFLREKVRRNEHEIALIGKSLEAEASDMLSDPYIYRTPNQFNCGYCSFVGPCLARWEGAAYQTMLEGNYRLRSGNVEHSGSPSGVSVPRP